MSQTPNLTWQYVEKWAKERPDEEALVFEDQRLTWAMFNEKMNLAAKTYIPARSRN